MPDNFEIKQEKERMMSKEKYIPVEEKVLKLSKDNVEFLQIIVNSRR